MKKGSAISVCLSLLLMMPHAAQAMGGVAGPGGTSCDAGYVWDQSVGLYYDNTGSWYSRDCVGGNWTYEPSAYSRSIPTAACEKVFSYDTNNYTFDPSVGLFNDGSCWYTRDWVGGGWTYEPSAYTAPVSTVASCPTYYLDPARNLYFDDANNYYTREWNNDCWEYHMQYPAYSFIPESEVNCSQYTWDPANCLYYTPSGDWYTRNYIDGQWGFQPSDYSYSIPTKPVDRSFTVDPGYFWDPSVGLFNDGNKWYTRDWVDNNWTYLPTDYTAPITPVVSYPTYYLDPTYDLYFDNQNNWYDRDWVNNNWIYTPVDSPVFNNPTYNVPSNVTPTFNVPNVVPTFTYDNYYPFTPQNYTWDPSTNLYYTPTGDWYNLGYFDNNWSYVPSDYNRPIPTAPTTPTFNYDNTNFNWDPSTGLYYTPTDWYTRDWDPTNNNWFYIPTDYTAPIPTSVPSYPVYVLDPTNNNYYYLPSDPNTYYTRDWDDNNWVYTPVSTHIPSTITPTTSTPVVTSVPATVTPVAPYDPYALSDPTVSVPTVSGPTASVPTVSSPTTTTPITTLPTYPTYYPVTPTTAPNYTWDPATNLYYTPNNDWYNLDYYNNDWVYVPSPYTGPIPTTPVTTPTYNADAPNYTWDPYTGLYYTPNADWYTRDYNPTTNNWNYTPSYYTAPIPTYRPDYSPYTLDPATNYYYYPDNTVPYTRDWVNDRWVFEPVTNPSTIVPTTPVNPPASVPATTEPVPTVTTPTYYVPTVTTPTYYPFEPANYVWDPATNLYYSPTTNDWYNIDYANNNWVFTPSAYPGTTPAATVPTTPATTPTTPTTSTPTTPTYNYNNYPYTWDPSTTLFYTPTGDWYTRDWDPNTNNWTYTPTQYTQPTPTYQPSYVPYYLDPARNLYYNPAYPDNYYNRDWVGDNWVYQPVTVTPTGTTYNPTGYTYDPNTNLYYDPLGNWYNYDYDNGRWVYEPSAYPGAVPAPISVHIPTTSVPTVTTPATTPTYDYNNAYPYTYDPNTTLFYDPTGNWYTRDWDPAANNWTYTPSNYRGAVPTTTPTYQYVYDPNTNYYTYYTDPNTYYNRNWDPTNNNWVYTPVTTPSYANGYQPGYANPAWDPTYYTWDPSMGLYYDPQGNWYTRDYNNGNWAYRPSGYTGAVPTTVTRTPFTYDTANYTWDPYTGLYYDNLDNWYNRDYLNGNWVYTPSAYNGAVPATTPTYTNYYLDPNTGLYYNDAGNAYTRSWTDDFWDFVATTYAPAASALSSANGLVWMTNSATEYLNVRAEPSMGAPIVGRIAAQGNVLGGYSGADGWFAVYDNAGNLVGYSISQYMYAN